jgi:hypothetical protein
MRPLFSIQLKSPPPSAIRYLAAGDFCIGEGVAEDSRMIDELYSPDVRALLADKSISTVGVEFPLVRAGPPINKSGPHLTGSPRTIDALLAGKFDVACLANNHIRDFGPESVLQTRDMIQKSGLATVGVGKNEADASQPLCKEVDGVKIGILGFAEEQFSCADETSAGAAKLDLPVCVNRLQELREKVDVAVVLVHGGVEFSPLPSPQAQRRYRLLVDCGASAVIGHHPHSVQGMEIYRGAPILYSLGNFCLPFPSTEPLPACWPYGIVASLAMSSEGIHDIKCFVVRHDAQTVRPRIVALSDDELERFRGRWARLNEIVLNPSLLSEFWRCICHDRGPSFRSEFVGAAAAIDASPWYLTKAAVRRLAPAYGGSAVSTLAWRYMTGARARDDAITRMCDLIRCPSHHDVLQTLLEMAMENRPFTSPYRDEYVQLMKY